MFARARDICTAAFENDVERLRLLVTGGILGGYHGFKTESWMRQEKAVLTERYKALEEQHEVHTSARYGEINNNSVNNSNENDKHTENISTYTRNNVKDKEDVDNQSDNSDIDEGELDEDEIDLQEDEELKIDNDAEYIRVKTQYTLDENSEEDEDEEENDNDDDDDDDEKESESFVNELENKPRHARYDKEKELAHQERDLRHYRVLIRNKLRQSEIAARINTSDLIYYNSATNVPSDNVHDRTSYGFFCTIKEQQTLPVLECATIKNTPFADASASATAEVNNKLLLEQENNTKSNLMEHISTITSNSNNSRSKNNNVDDNKTNANNTFTAAPLLRVTWKPSKRSKFVASPLHWAVLGRAHDAVQFLIANGANVNDEITFTERHNEHISSEERRNNTQYAWKRVSKYNNNNNNNNNYIGSNGSASDFACALVEHSSLTAAQIAQDNRSEITYSILTNAIRQRERTAQLELYMRLRLESKLERRKAKKEKRKLEHDQRCVAREEAAELRERQKELRQQQGEDGEEEEEYEEDDDVNNKVEDDEKEEEEGGRRGMYDKHDDAITDDGATVSGNSFAENE